MKQFYAILRIIVVMIPPFVSETSGQITFLKKFDGMLYGHEVHILPDSGFLLEARHVTTFFGYNQVVHALIRTDKFGDTLWTNNYIPADSFWNDAFTIKSVIQTSNGNLLFAAVQQTVPFRINICSLDQFGNVLWSNSYSLLGSTEDIRWPVMILPADSSRASIFFNYRSDPAHLYPACLTIDSTGSIIQATYYSMTNYVEFVDVIQSSRGGYYLLCKQPFVSTFKSIILGINNTGSFTWSREYNMRNADFTMQSLVEDRAGALYLVGHENLTQGSRTYLMKVDSMQAPVFCNIYSDAAHSSRPKAAQTGLVRGDEICLGLAGNSFMVLCLDLQGSINFCKSYNMQTQAGGAIIKSTLDGGFILTGEGAYMLKTDSLGNNPCSIDEFFVIDSSLTMSDSVLSFTVNSITLSSSPLFISHSINVSVSAECIVPGIEESGMMNETIFPVPFRDILIVECSGCLGKQTQVNIYETSGRKVFSEDFSHGSELEIIGLQKLNAGIYFIEVINHGTRKVHKAVKG